jgi:hypothetical protein
VTTTAMESGGPPALAISALKLVLFRPVGLNELSLIWDSGMREFPPRLPHQPIFYPVANQNYATQIARDWNTKDSNFAGYVTKFSVQDSQLADYENRTQLGLLRMSNTGYRPNTFHNSTRRSKE